MRPSTRAAWRIGRSSRRRNLKVKSFVGTSRNAVMTQLRIAMRMYLLVSHLKFASRLGWSRAEILPSPTQICSSADLSATSSEFAWS